MTDLTALENLIAEDVRDEVGPEEAIDALAIARQARADSARWRFPSMFSTLKFVAAGVIVALFGGFLLAGLLTAPQGNEVAPAAVTGSPSTIDSWPTGMVTREVQPGILQVISDGVRDLTSFEASDIVAGYDGGIWLLEEDAFLRLGREGSLAWPEGSDLFESIFEVAPDGTMWIISPRFPDTPGSSRSAALRSADGETWAPLACPKPCSVCQPSCAGVTVMPDGEVWSSWRDESGDGTKWSVGHLEPSGWRPIEGYGPGEFSGGGFGRLYVADAGELYGLTDSLYRYDDGEWSRVSGLNGWGFPAVGVGQDGTVWQSGKELLLFGEAADGTSFEHQGQTSESDAFTEFPAGPYSVLGEGLARFAGGEWTAWTPGDLPDVDLPTRAEELEIAPDGSLWIDSSCHGLVRFDGETTAHFLPGRCVSMDIAADGSVWVLTDEEGGKNLYVITPEAVAASR